MTEIKIETIQDIANLTPEQFKRFIPDLIKWHELIYHFSKLGLKSPGMRWIDDGKHGEINSIEIVVEHDTK